MESQNMMNAATYGTATQGIPALYLHLQQQQQKRTTIGFVTELSSSEMRVALTPAAVRELVNAGQTVYFQTEAGMTAGFTDETYQQAGAIKLQTAQDVYQRSHIMVKVQQPTTQELNWVQPQQIIFCFLAAADSQNQTQNTNTQVATPTQLLQAVTQRQATVFSYECILKDEMTAPIMNALSEVAGDMAVQQAMRMMETKYGGKGELVGQIAGEEGARVTIIGSGVAAMRAARTASAIGAQVTVMDTCTENLRLIREQLKTPVQTMTFNSENLEKILPETKILIGAVAPAFNTLTETDEISTDQDETSLAQMYAKKLRPLVSAGQMMLLKKDTVAIDLAVAYGGNFELDNRVFHYQQKDALTNGLTTVFAAQNITNLVPHTATKAIANSVFAYVKKVAQHGWEAATAEDKTIRRALIVANGQLKCMRIWELLNEKENNTNGTQTQQHTTQLFEAQKQNQQQQFFDSTRRISAEQQKAVKQLLNIINNSANTNTNTNTNTTSNTTTRFPIEA